MLHAVDYWGRVVPDSLPGHNSGENNGDPYIQNGAHNQCGNDSDREIALGIASFFSSGRNRIETDIGEENDRASGQDSRPSVRRKRMPVSGTDVLRSGDDKS